MAWEPDTGIGGARHTASLQPARPCRLPRRRAVPRRARRFRAIVGRLLEARLQARAHSRGAAPTKRPRTWCRASSSRCRGQTSLARLSTPAKARLRTYLRGCLDHFVLKQDESADAAETRRRSRIRVASISKPRTARSPSSAPSPEDVFFREWQPRNLCAGPGRPAALCEATRQAGPTTAFSTRYDLAEGATPGLRGTGRRTRHSGQRR